MDLDTANSIEVITVSTISTPGSSGKKVVPLQIGYKFPLIDNAETGKLRRPVRPIDRQRMRPWLMELLDLGNVFGLRWTNRHQGVFQISWRHASRLGWNLETDGDVFERWARHTGIYREGDPPEPKRWKANFRCALHSLHDVVELTSAVERKGRNACRTYRFLHSSDQQSIFRKKAKSRKVKEQSEKSYEKLSGDEPQAAATDSASSEENISESESDWSHEDKVIVQEVNLRTEIPEEEYGLHHDHDYSAGPDKTQKTIVLRQGVGSIMLQKEFLSAQEEKESDQSLLISNLDQLASAAMSSAGMKEAHVHSEKKKDKKIIRHKQAVKVVTDSPDNDTQAVNVSDMKLECLLSDKFEKTHLMRKRKTSSDESKSDFSEVSSGTKKVSKKKPLNTVTSTSPPTPYPLALFRSGSPKILCRRSKRNSSKSDKNAEPTEILVTTSEATEPLMSSCLLLLEAATRLDNAEKNGRSGTHQRDGSSQEAPKLEIVETIETSPDCDTREDNPGKDGISPATAISKVRRVVIKQGTQIKTVDNLEKLHLQSNWKQTVVKETTVGPRVKPDGKLLVSEAKGLFSGSNINSSAQAAVVMKRKNKDPTQIQPPKTKYFVVPRNNETEPKVAEEATTVPDAVIKTAAGKQHVVIQRSLPVLKPAPLKTTSDIPLVIDSSNSVKAVLKEPEILDRKLHGQPLIAVDKTKQGALYQGSVYSVLSSLNCSETSGSNASPKILLTSPLSANTLTLSPVTSLNAPVLLNTSYNFQTRTQPEGILNSLPVGLAKGQALVMYGKGKDTLNDLQVHVVPMTPGRAPNVLSHVVISTSSSAMTHSSSSSSLSSTSTAITNTKSTRLLVPHASVVQSKVRPELRPTASLRPQAHLVNVTKENVQAPKSVKSFKNQSNSSFLIRTSSDIQGKKESNIELDAVPLNSSVLSNVNVENLEISKESNRFTMLANPDANSSSTSSTPLVLGFKQALETQNLKSDDRSTVDSVKPLSEICKRYLSQLFSTLDNQSSESEDSDSIGDMPRRDHSQTSVNCTVEYLNSHDELGITDYHGVRDTSVECEPPQASHASVVESNASDELANSTAAPSPSGEDIPLLTPV